jgi:hypothetical protein
MKGGTNGRSGQMCETEVNGLRRSEEMTSFSAKAPPLENKLVGTLLRQYPQMSKIIQRHFGGHCLKRPGFQIQTLEMACILFGVEQKRLLQEVEGNKN